MRFEVDACYSSNLGSGSATDVLADALSSLSVSAPSSRAKDRTAFGVTVIEAGSKVPQSALIELKTRSARNVDSFDWADAYPQLYLGQTPTSIIGVHRSGTFFETREKKIDSAYLKGVGAAAQRRSAASKSLGNCFTKSRSLSRREARTLS